MYLLNQLSYIPDVSKYKPRNFEPKNLQASLSFWQVMHLNKGGISFTRILLQLTGTRTLYKEK